MRLTYYDHMVECYKIKPDAPQGQIIQRLGAYEDDMEKLKEVLADINITPTEACNKIKDILGAN